MTLIISNFDEYPFFPFISFLKKKQTFSLLLLALLWPPWLEYAHSPTSLLFLREELCWFNFTQVFDELFPSDSLVFQAFLFPFKHPCKYCFCNSVTN